MKYLVIIFILVLAVNVNCQISSDSEQERLKFENELETLNRPTRSEFDSRDKQSIEFILNKIKEIKKDELAILSNFELFFSEKDTPFTIVYNICETLLKEYKSDLIIKYIWEQSDKYRIDYSLQSLWLEGDIYRNYPVRTFIFDNKSLFLDFLVNNGYFSKEISERDLPAVYTVLGDFIDENGELNTLLWLRDNISIYSFNSANSKKIKEFHNKYRYRK